MGTRCKTLSRLARIRNKPMVKLTSAEISLLTRKEQRWVLAYRAEQRAAKAQS